MSAIIGDVFGAATTLAGLLLVFMGGLVGAYQQLDPARRQAVGGSFRRRGILGLIGFLAACASAAAAILAHAGMGMFFANLAVAFLLVSFAALISSAIVIFRILFDRD